MRKIAYNSPVVLTFSLLAAAVFLMDQVWQGFVSEFFAVRPSMNPVNPLDYWRLLAHVLGHASWEHLMGNLTFVLLLGPILEEKYGSANMLIMIALTALVTGVINVLFFSTALLGASGVVFMLITLISIVDIERGTIPMTFVLVALIFVGREVVNMFRADSISQAGHIIGGIAGAVFGFRLSRKSKYKPG